MIVDGNRCKLVLYYFQYRYFMYIYGRLYLYSILLRRITIRRRASESVVLYYQTINFFAYLHTISSSKAEELIIRPTTIILLSFIDAIILIKIYYLRSSFKPGDVGHHRSIYIIVIVLI